MIELNHHHGAHARGREHRDLVPVRSVDELVARHLFLRQKFETPPTGQSPTEGCAGGCLVCGLFRDSVEFCSGLVDLVECVGDHRGGGRRFALAGE